MNNIFSTRYLSKKRVLIVGDIIDYSQLLVTILEMEGYQVETVDCGYTAISKIEANPPHVVLLGLIMSGINGSEVTKWIRENHPSVAVVLIAEDCQLKDLLIQVQLDGFLTKPIDVDRAISTIQAIFTNKSLTSQIHAR